MKTLLFKIGITLGLFALLAYQIDLKAAFSRMTELSVVAVILGVAIGLTQILILAYRWKLVSNFNNLTLPLAEIIRCSLACQFFNQGLPSSVGGDVLRVWWLRRLSISLEASIQSVLLDRVAGLISLLGLTIVAVGLLFTSQDTSAGLTDVLFVISFSVMFVLVAASRFARGILVLSFRLAPSVIKTNSFLRKLVRWMLKIHSGCWQLVFESRGLIILAWGVVIHMSVVILCYLLAIDTGIDISFMQLMSVVPLVLLLSYLPISIGGWGLREGGMAAGFSFIGLSSGDGVFLGLSLGVVIFMSAILGALVWVLSPMPVSISGRIAEESNQ